MDGPIRHGGTPHRARRCPPHRGPTPTRRWRQSCNATGSRVARLPADRNPLPDPGRADLRAVRSPCVDAGCSSMRIEYLTGQVAATVVKRMAQWDVAIRQGKTNPPFLARVRAARRQECWTRPSSATSRPARPGKRHGSRVAAKWPGSSVAARWLAKAGVKLLGRGQWKRGAQRSKPPTLLRHDKRSPIRPRSRRGWWRAIHQMGRGVVPSATIHRVLPVRHTQSLLDYRRAALEQRGDPTNRQAMLDGETADDLLSPSGMVVHRLAVLLRETPLIVGVGHQGRYHLFVAHLGPIPLAIDSADLKGRPHIRQHFPAIEPGQEPPDAPGPGLSECSRAARIALARRWYSSRSPNMLA